MAHKAAYIPSAITTAHFKRANKSDNFKGEAGTGFVQANQRLTKISRDTC